MVIKSVLSIKNSIVFIIAFSCTIVSMEVLSDQPFDMHHLHGNYFLKKEDYFSKYSLVVVNDSQQETIARVDKIHVAKNHDIILETSSGHILLASNAESHSQILDLPQGLKVIEPRKYIEANTIKEPISVVRQILQIGLTFFICNISLKLCEKNKGLFRGHTIQKR